MSCNFSVGFLEKIEISSFNNFQNLNCKFKKQATPFSTNLQSRILKQILKFREQRNADFGDWSCNFWNNKNFLIFSFINYFQTKESSSLCLSCGSKFRSELLRILHHVRVHKSYTCTTCDRKFTRQGFLSRHGCSSNGDAEEEDDL